MSRHSAYARENNEEKTYERATQTEGDRPTMRSQQTQTEFVFWMAMKYPLGEARSCYNMTCFGKPSKRCECRSAFYCDRKCQRADRPRHQPDCNIGAAKHIFSSDPPARKCMRCEKVRTASAEICTSCAYTTKPKEGSLGRPLCRTCASQWGGKCPKCCNADLMMLF